MGVAGVAGAALTAMLAWCMAGAAQSAPSLDDIVARHLEARGGYETIKAIQTLKITRTVATPFSSVEVVTYRKRPNLLRVDQTPKAGAQSSRGVSDETAWDFMQGKLLTRPEKVALETREIEADFDGLLVDWKDKGHTVALQGSDEIGGRNAWKLKVTTKNGFVRHVFIDKETYLEAGMSGTALLPAIDPKTKEHRTQHSTFVYSDYRDVNGVKFPFSIDEDRTAGPITQSFATYTEKIEIDVPFDDALFAPPSAAGPGK